MRARSWIPGLVIFGIGLAVVLWYGRRGFQPQDQSIIFDGGWRTLHGQVPLRDYVTPSGILPSLMQAGLFKLFGVSWRTYCLHAALLNGLFCVLVYVVLGRFRARRLIAFTFAVASSLIFYAPFGVPYMEQHAFFFILLATWLLVESSSREAGHLRAAGYLAVPAIVGLAALSKQLPTVFFPPLALAYVLVADRLPARALRLLGVGTVGAGAICLALVAAFRIPFTDVFYYMVKLPFTGALPQRGFIASIVPFPRWRLVAPSVTYGGILAPLLLTAFPVPRRRGPAVLVPSVSRRMLVLLLGVLVVVGVGLLSSVPDSGVFAATLGGTVAAALAFTVLLCWAADAVPVLVLDRLDRGRLLLAGGLLIVCALFTSATNNELENGIPFDFLAAGLVLAALTTVAGRIVRGERRRIVLACVSGVFLGAVLIDAGIFAFATDLRRTVNDMSFRQPPATVEAALPDTLRFLQWDTPPWVKYRPQDLDILVRRLRSMDGHFVLFGDASVLYAVVGQASESPALWYHPGLTYPLSPANRVASFERRLLHRIDVGIVKRVVFEAEPSTQMSSGAKLSDFPGLEQRVERGCQTTRVATFTVVELCPPH